MTPYPITYVLWSDSCVSGQGPWHSAEDLKEWLGERHLIESVGFLIFESKDHIVLAGSRHGVDEGLRTADEMKIPKGCIIRRKRLKRP